MSIDPSEQERISAETIRHSDDRFRKAFELSPAPMAITTLRTGQIVDVNQRLLRVSGYAREEMIGQTSLETGLHANEQERAKLVEQLRAGSVMNRPMKYRVRDGSIREALGSFEIIEIEGQLCILTVLDDVTEQRLLEEELRQAQKMESLGQLAGGVAHDFNNVLTIIQLSTRSLAREVGPRVDGPVEDILAATRRAADLVRKLMAFSRRQMLRPEVLDLSSVFAERTVPVLQRLLGEDIEIVLRPSDRPCLVRADEAQLEQSLINLANNARDAMAVGGSLTIEVFDVELGDRATALSMSPGRYCAFAMTDSGMGMDATTRARIFEPFFTTKPLGKGTGLGLAMVYGFVKQSGGAITVDSEPTRGARFTIYLPAVEETHVVKPAESVPTTIEKTGGSILLVEDESAVRRAVATTLEANGFDVIVSATPREAIRTAKTIHGIDLLITDVVLPGTTGPQLAREVTEVNPGISILFMSGYLESDSRLDQIPSGAPFLGKPFTPEDLVAQVSMILVSRRRGQVP